MNPIEKVLLVLAVAFLVAGAFEATRFPLRYRRTNYRRTAEGRHLMRFTAALAVALWGTLLGAWLPLPQWASLLLAVAVYAWLAFELHVRNRLFTANQRRRGE
jgi:hypothetical protein